MEEECGIKEPCVGESKCTTCHRVIMVTTGRTK